MRLGKRNREIIMLSKYLKKSLIWSLGSLLGSMKVLGILPNYSRVFMHLRVIRGYSIVLFDFIYGTLETEGANRIFSLSF
jgi:hypothetical protein